MQGFELAEPNLLWLQTQHKAILSSSTTVRDILSEIGAILSKSPSK